ncbi:hypothetical protein [Bdellovibrio svalbardensis]|uniref:Uncharacterized protein n=1 Tax=Bdellovibrio svalbardensis TaxID=2972972 RepID=A0ABT6DQT0_9BACT|nr:hypothetical protein [Bdellovibrio svalbardensis]MDG0818269.1 hypothetical protein [Bdellovibrio svalbardensis]
MASSFSIRYGLLAFLFILFAGLPQGASAKNFKRPNTPPESQSTAAGPNALELVKPLNTLSADFYDFVLRYGGRLIPAKDLQPWIVRMHEASEAYFNSIGVKFSIQTVKREQMEFQGSYVEKISYNLYTLTSVENASELNGEFIQGILQDESLGDLKLIYDPFLQLWSGPIQGFFEPSTYSLVFSTTALSYRVGGLGDTLTHEIRHAQEHNAILKGFPSLASFTFLSNKSSPEVYSQFLRLDEAETHALDIQFLVETAPSLEALLTDKSSLKRLREARQKSLEFKRETLQRIIASTQGTLARLKKEIQIHGVTNLNCAPEPLTTMKSSVELCKFSDPEAEHYERLEIRVAQKPRINLDAQLSSLLTWSLGRLNNLQ